nr:MAG TPA: hypothetical protein [Caudoviricetes sp.]DAN78004.1 MAG TPA: hypothetical protein [Caudoviricetes sp.]
MCIIRLVVVSLKLYFMVSPLRITLPRESNPKPSYTR